MYFILVTENVILERNQILFEIFLNETGAIVITDKIEFSLVSTIRLVSTNCNGEESSIYYKTEWIIYSFHHSN